MAITLDKVSTAVGTSVISLQWTHTVSGANTFLIVGGAIGPPGTISTISCNNLIMQRERDIPQGAEAQGILWSLPRPSAAALTISAVAVASITGWAFGSISYNGVHQVGPEGTSVGQSFTNVAVANLSISTSATNVVLGFVGGRSMTTMAVTVPATQTARYQASGGAGVWIQCSEITAAGVAVSFSWSFSTAQSFFGMGIPISAVSASTGSATTIVLTSGTTWTVPADFNATNNTVECWGGGGGGGGANGGSPGSGGGGGGGAYARITNFAPAGGSVSYSVGAAGTAGLSVGPTAGGAGGNTFFHSTTTVLAAGGLGGGNGTSQAGGGGGTSGSSVGTVKFNGGNGGNSAAGTAPGGGGGAAGPDGVGSAGAAGSGPNAGAGGYGDAGKGGAGGIGGAIGGGAGEAEEVGGGGGGGDGDTTANNGGAGGLPGGGGGGGSRGVATPGGAGGGGQIRITYVPSAVAAPSSSTFTLAQMNVGH